MKPEYNAFLTYWPWLLPIGIVVAAGGLLLGGLGILPAYWAGFAVGFGLVAAFTGLGMLIARLYHRRSRK